MISYSAAPAASRRLRPFSSSATPSFTGSSTETVTLGNQRRCTWLRERRENGVASSPSMRTGTTIAPDLSAIRPTPS